MSKSQLTVFGLCLLWRSRLSFSLFRTHYLSSFVDCRLPFLPDPLPLDLAPSRTLRVCPAISRTKFSSRFSVRSRFLVISRSQCWSTRNYVPKWRKREYIKAVGAKMRISHSHSLFYTSLQLINMPGCELFCYFWHRILEVMKLQADKILWTNASF